MKVSEVFIETLAEAGVKRVYGVTGDSLNGITDAIRRNKTIEWMHMRHEEAAAFAAGAESHLTGEIAVCAGSQRHLGKQKVSLGVAGAQITSVRAACIEPPIPGGKDQHVGDPKRGRRAQQS